MQHSSDQTYTLWQIESWARKTGQITEARAAARHRRRRYPRGLKPPAGSPSASMSKPVTATTLTRSPSFPVELELPVARSIPWRPE
jgi:hypothetical protein